MKHIDADGTEYTWKQLGPWVSYSLDDDGNVVETVGPTPPPHLDPLAKAIHQFMEQAANRAIPTISQL